MVPAKFGHHHRLPSSVINLKCYIMQNGQKCTDVMVNLHSNVGDAKTETIAWDMKSLPESL